MCAGQRSCRSLPMAQPLDRRLRWRLWCWGWDCPLRALEGLSFSRWPSMTACLWALLVGPVMTHLDSIDSRQPGCLERLRGDQGCTPVLSRFKPPYLDAMCQLMSLFRSHCSLHGPVVKGDAGVMIRCTLNSDNA